MDACKENIVGRVGEREDEEMRKRKDGEENEDKQEEEERELEDNGAIVKEEKA